MCQGGGGERGQESLVLAQTPLLPSFNASLPFPFNFIIKFQWWCASFSDSEFGKAAEAHRL